MKLGPVEIIWNTQTSYRQRLRSIVHEYMIDVLSTDTGMRAIIARCARSEAKDYLGELAEAEATARRHIQRPDLMLNGQAYCSCGRPWPCAAETYLGREISYRLPTEDELQTGIREVQPIKEGPES